MNLTEQSRWKNVVLDVVLEAIASGTVFNEHLVFKGARVLNLHLGFELRQSLDIDSNLTVQFAAEVPDHHEMATRLQEGFSRVISTFFRHQETIRFELARVRVKPKLPRPHPRGWDAFEAQLNVRDLLKPDVLGLPAIIIDIAAPETLLDDSTVTRMLGTGHLTCYSLKRIAGEKLRAYLSSLPTYVKKIGKRGTAIRAKDIYDIARILRKEPLLDSKGFWKAALAEFVVCCKSRFVDCQGLESFEEDLVVAKKTYESDSTIPKDISFDVAWECLATIVRFFDAEHIFPLHFPLPADS